MVNYERINGVSYTRYVDDEDEPAASQGDATVDELYWADGKLIVRVSTVDGHISLGIPILPKDSWNSFVESLPVWDGE